MTARVCVLAEGYSKLSESRSNVAKSSVNKYASVVNAMKANCTCTLVQANGINLIFDTMGPYERFALEQSLARQRLHPDDIDIVVCSHGHPDHIGNLNLFQKADLHIVGKSIYHGDTYFDTPFVDWHADWGATWDSLLASDQATPNDFKLSRADMFVRYTPGHTLECVSLIVKNCVDLGTVALSGDLFEREDDLNDDSVWIHAGSQNQFLQTISRQAMLKLADYIVPGHGHMFKVPTINSN